MFDIHHNFIVHAGTEKVFEAFSAPEALDSWWTLQSSGTPEIGNLYAFYFGPGYDWSAEIIHMVPSQEVTWRMVKTMDDWKDTKVGFTLAEKEGSTHVHFFHLGWTEASEHFGVTNFCWGQLLNGLKNYVERGVLIPYSQRN